MKNCFIAHRDKNVVLHICFSKTHSLQILFDFTGAVKVAFTSVRDLLSHSNPLEDQGGTL